MKRLFIILFSFFVSVSIYGQPGSATSSQNPSWPQNRPWPQFQQNTQKQGEDNNQQPRISNSPQQAGQFSPTDYRNRQKDFISKHAGLTETEANQFFPLYYELQEKKRDLNREARQQAVHPQNRPFTEEEYTKIVDNMANLDIKIAELEKSYIDKYKKVIPASKILKVQMAEEQFNSEILKDMLHQRSWYNNGQNYPGQNTSGQNFPGQNFPGQNQFYNQRNN
jgi:hypothetical protein